MRLFSSTDDAAKAAAAAREQATRQEERSAALSLAGDRFGAYIASSNARVARGWAEHVDPVVEGR